MSGFLVAGGGFAPEGLKNGDPRRPNIPDGRVAVQPCRSVGIALVAHLTPSMGIVEMNDCKFITPAQMFKSKPQKFTYDGTLVWLKQISSKCKARFAELEKALLDKSSPPPRDLMRTDTQYEDGSWNSIFRVLRPERIEPVIGIIQSFKFKSGTDIDKATNLRNLIKPIIEGWLIYISQLEVYSGNKTRCEQLRVRFKRLSSYCKLFVVDDQRITAGEIFHSQNYRSSFNEFVNCYSDFIAELNTTESGGTKTLQTNDNSKADIISSRARASFQRNAGLFAIAREGCLSGLQRGS